eukprot:7909802-Alexandrium_andersonii.AAC.1
MSASLVGSEMCIRDRLSPEFTRRVACGSELSLKSFPGPEHGLDVVSGGCLLYTSDAADDM